MQLTKDCFVFSDGREFCSNDKNSLKFYVNDEKKDDISKYVISEDDRILISYGPETAKEVEEQLEELESMARYNYRSIEKLMNIDVGTVREGTYDSDLGFSTAEKLMRIDMARQSEKGKLENTLSQKRHEYNTLVKNSGDPAAHKSLQAEIEQLESQLENFGKDFQYTTEEVFQRVSEIEDENIKMYKIGPEEYEKYVLAMKNLEATISEEYATKSSPDTGKESFPLESVFINQEKNVIEVVLQKKSDIDSDKMEQYKTIINNTMPNDIPWTVTIIEND